MLKHEPAPDPQSVDRNFRLSRRPLLKGKRVLITGAGTGVGRGIALEFAREGAQVAMHYCHSKQHLQSALNCIQAAGGQAAAFQADFRELSQVKGLARKALRYLGGGLDILVNNAGITANIPFCEVSERQFDTLMAVNLKAMYFLTQFVAPQMIKRRDGRIINLSSMHASRAMVEHSVYAATKAAIEAFSRVIAMELGHFGIRVNCIAPGWCLVENHFLAHPKNTDFSKFAGSIPAGYISTPRDLGRLAIFLASEDSHYFLGETIEFTGGLGGLFPNHGDCSKRLAAKFGRRYINSKYDSKPRRR